jgi:hypothetical protein
MVMYEMIARTTPFKDLTNIFQLKETVCDKRMRPVIPSNCSHSLSSLMVSCWQHEPKKRPNFIEIISSLESMK